MKIHENYHPLYSIEGTKNFDENPCFWSESTFPPFQDGLAHFQQKLIDLVANDESKTFYKFGDGDYFFLKKIPQGSANPGRRAIGVSYDQLANHNEFVEGVSKNDFFTCEIYPENISKFQELYPNVMIDYPAEYGYGLTANRWLLQQFAGKIGVIGAHEKVKLIEHLLSFKEYQDYLGIERFNDYISIPQRFACDNLDATEDMVAKQLEQSSDETKIYLLGIGHVKSGLLHRLKEHKNAIYLDVGSGIDALAGVIDPGRPYMGGWKNHLSRQFNYGSLDFLNHTPDPNRDVVLG